MELIASLLRAVAFFKAGCGGPASIVVRSWPAHPTLWARCQLRTPVWPYRSSKKTISFPKAKIAHFKLRGNPNEEAKTDVLPQFRAIDRPDPTGGSPVHQANGPFTRVLRDQPDPMRGLRFVDIRPVCPSAQEKSTRRANVWEKMQMNQDTNLRRWRCEKVQMWENAEERRCSCAKMQMKKGAYVGECGGMSRCSYAPLFLKHPSLRCSREKRKRMSDSLVAVARSHKTACHSHTTTQAKSKNTSACQTRYWHSCIRRKFRLRMQVQKRWLASPFHHWQSLRCVQYDEKKQRPCMAHEHVQPCCWGILRAIHWCVRRLTSSYVEWGDNYTLWHLEDPNSTIVTHFGNLELQFRRWLHFGNCELQMPGQLHTLALWSSEFDDSYTLWQFGAANSTTITHFGNCLHTLAIWNSKFDDSYTLW